MSNEPTAAREAWRNYVGYLASLEERIFHEPEDGNFVGESLEHVVRQVVNWTEWGALHADPTRPAFQRHLDLVTQWGGPNADNVYRHARISAQHRYRLRGRMHSCEEFVLTLRAGFFHNTGYGTKAAYTASELGISERDDFEILLGGDDAGAIPIPEGTLNASLREYYIDWRAEEPAVFTIECLDPPAPPQRLETDEIVTRVEAARVQVKESIEFYREYMRTRRSEQPDNFFPPTMKITKGYSAARYENCYWRLEPGEALIVEGAEPNARYWSAQTYLMDTFDLVDRTVRVSSRNQTQTRVSADGRVRWVLAAEDPGVANWLETAGRRVGLCFLRWFWPTGDTESGFDLGTRVVPASEVRSHLPDDEPVVTAEQRAAELAQRQEHLRWRFRT
jgi:hypothetical protein